MIKMFSQKIWHVDLHFVTGNAAPAEHTFFCSLCLQAHTIFFVLLNGSKQGSSFTAFLLST